MANQTKKDSQKPWNFQKAIMNIENEDEQDIYISERSSIASSEDFNVPIVSPPAKRQATPSPPIIFFQKPFHTLRLIQEEPSEIKTFVPTNQIHLEQKDEKIKKKTRRAELKPPEYHVHPQPTIHGHPPKLKAPTRKVRHRALVDNQVISYESFDGSNNSTQGVLITSSIKPGQVNRTSRREGCVPSLIASNHSMPIENDYSPRKMTPRQHFNMKETENDERRDTSNRRNQVNQRRRTKANLDWADHHSNPLPSNKIMQDPNSLIITSNNSHQRTTNRQKHSNRTDLDESSKSRSHPINSPSIPSNNNHFTHSFHQHIRRRQPSGSQISSDLPNVDSNAKKSDRANHFSNSKDIFHNSPAPSSSIGNYTYLPPIARESPSKPAISRFPNEYYGTLAKQNPTKDWDDPLDVPKIYKPDGQNRFYDRYLRIGSDKRLVT